MYGGLSELVQDMVASKAVRERVKKGDQGSAYIWEEAGSEDAAPLDKNDPMYVDEAAEAPHQ